MMTVARIMAAVTPNFNILTFNLNYSTLLFKYLLCIYYPMQFKKNSIKTRYLINFGNGVNTIT